MTLDLVIRDGTILDGNGGPGFRGDVGVAAGRIVALGSVADRGEREIDAGGRAVAPGFIDLHTHYDAQVAWDPHCTPSCFHGVTSVVMGNCGYGMAPVRKRDRDYTLGLFSQVEGVSKSTLVRGVPFEWESQDEFADWLEARGLGINVVTQVGHSSVRRFVLGEAASERPAQEEEVRAMERWVREGLSRGAAGFTTSRVPHQKGEHGEPIPSFVAEESELFALAGVLREFDGRVLGINPRSKARDFDAEDREQLVRLARHSGSAVNWNEFNQRWDYPDQWSSLLDYMEQSQASGAGIYAVMRCQRMDIPFRLSEGDGFVLTDRWKQFMQLSPGEKLSTLADTSLREGLARDIDAAFFSAEPLPRRIGVARAGSAGNAALEGRILAEVARERGVDPAMLFLEIALEEQLETVFAFCGVSNGEDAAVETMLRSPATLTGISDAGAHLHIACGADYPTYFLAHWVREKQAFSLAEGVARLTAEAADFVGLADRGRIRAGAAADLVVFDPEEVRPQAVELRDDLPGGESRQFKRARGIEFVVVNGQVAVEGDTLTGNLPGRVLGRA